MGPLSIKGWGLGVAIMGSMAWACPLTAADARIPNITHPAIHFESDSTAVILDDIPKMDDNVSWLQRYPRAVVILEGHCDQTGGADYNVELGDRRAREVKSYLIDRGISPDRVIMVVSFGEKRPVAPGETYVALGKNRRVEFVLR